MNKLAGSTSPYLLQHADNPVHWYPWGPEALEIAARENKPILLSIGYSACHWCHVMAHESFEREDTARLMNEHFVNIKVDREERPDLDRIYQTAHQLLTRNRGGWPLTMFLAPDDHLPFFGGTYFPPEARHGMPGFNDVLRRVAAAYTEHADDIAAYKQQMRDALAQTLGGGGGGGEPDPGAVDRACGQLEQAFDERHGGFGAAPKFPHPAGLALLMEAAHATEDAAVAARLLHVVDFTLEAMARGGLQDHLGGGFYRYAVDEHWTIPHFEKMLYDNGPLLELYALRAAHTGSTLLTEAAHGAADWALGTMRSAQGAFCSSLDADSEGEEGCYYLWTPEEAQAVLGADYPDFARTYGLDGPPNFEGRWHLRLPPPGGDAADPGLASARRALLARRARRVAPDRDDKILTAWNALMIRGLAVIGARLERPDCLEAATAAVDFLRRAHWRDGRLLATSRGGRAHLDGYLDDHAFLLDALLALLSARWRDAELRFAIELADVLLARFADPRHGGFFFTADDHETLVQRTLTFMDDSLPSGNGVAARALLELGHLLGEPRYLDAATAVLRAAMPEASRYPSACAAVMLALLDHAAPPPRAVLRTARGADDAEWRAALHAAAPARGRCYVIPAEAEGLPDLLAERRPHAGAAVTAYVCRGFECSAPATGLDAFRAALEG